MKLAIKLFGVLLILSGISLFINPEIFFGWLEESMESGSLYVIAILVRFILGVLFLLLSKESKYPGVINFFGYLFIIASIVFIFIGRVGFQDFFTPLIPEIKKYAAVNGVINILIGSLFVYSFSEDNKKPEKLQE